MKNQLLLLAIILSISTSYLYSAEPEAQGARIVINADLGAETISRHIYGHFSEHLGRCIYGGFYVGEDSDIPHTSGMRNDVVEALKKTSIPNLRWPGGCFADEYHWRDGIGPKSERPKMVNTHWGGVTEDNSFGTHEFLELCEQLGTEAYICGNVGSGTVEEMADWVEYINFNGTSPLADLRRVNGRDQAWGVTYWGVGNENWGCGGNMRPEFYADQYRRYATYCRNFGENRLKKVAGGASGHDFNWTEVLMKQIPHHMMWGLSLHHYMTDFSNHGSATDFSEADYFKTMNYAVEFGKILDGHIRIMDRHDPEKKVAMVVDEWGTWWDVEPGTNPGFLYQQNTLRDALLAGVSLNHFNLRCDRIKMANIAQTVNVLQAMVLTQEEKMLLTPTYHVFHMYQVHQDATLLPMEVQAKLPYSHGKKELDALSVSASRDGEGKVHVSMVNFHPKKDLELTLELRGMEVEQFSGSILTAEALNAHNTFENATQVKVEEFKDGELVDASLQVTLPAKSVVTLAFE